MFYCLLLCFLGFPLTFVNFGRIHSNLAFRPLKRVDFSTCGNQVPDFLDE